jgi:putative ABC transport system permease protein
VAYAYWFEGVYIDKKNFFPQFAASIPQYTNLAPELLIPLDQRSVFVKDRRGCLAGRKLIQRYGWKIGDAIVLKGTYFQGEYRFTLRAIYDGRDPSTDETMFFFHWDYLNEYLKKTAPELADQVGWFLVEIERPELAPIVAQRIDALFKNSLAETITETEKAFNLSFVEMTKAILMAIQVVSWAVIGVILVVLANTMAMSARERLGEYAVLKTMGFRPWHLAGIIVGESMIMALMGGVLGLTLSLPALRLFPKDVTQYFPILEISDTTAALGLSISLVVGVLAALLPAWRATRVGIAEALRKVG